MKYIPYLFLIFLFSACLSEGQQEELSALDSPATEETVVDTFVVGKRDSGVLAYETAEGESLRLENDSIIENIRLAITGTSSGEELVAGATTIVRNPDVAPSFPGGSAAMDKYIMKNLEYPLTAFQNDITGIVNIRFVIEPDGSLSGILVQKGLGFGCDEAAVDLIQGMPRWIPGRKGGVNVRCSVVLPLNFQKPEE